MEVPPLLLAGLLAAAVAAAQPPPARPGGKCSLEGRVVRAGTGEPLKKAWVALRKADGEQQVARGATTTSDGRFTLKDIEPGRYRLSAGRNGYVRREYGQRAAGRPGSIIELNPGQEREGLVIELIPAAVVAGRVYDEEGEPVAGAMVQAMTYRYLRRNRELVGVGRTATNDRGEYRLYGLNPGTYYISVTYSPEWRFLLFGRAPMSTREADWPPEESYVPTYFPGTTDPGAATLLELQPGQEMAAVDVVLVPTPGVRVRGRVFNAVTGRPGRDTSIMLVPRGGRVRSSILSPQAHVQEQDGSFEIRAVPPGSYFLVATWFDQEKRYMGHTPVEVGPGGADDVSVTIERGIEVSGRIRTLAPLRSPAGGSPSQWENSAGAPEKLDLTELEVGLVPREEVPLVGMETTKVKEDGAFELSNVPRGNYWPYVGGAPPDYYLKEARLGAEDVLQKGLALAGNQLSEPLELTLSSEGARIDGVALKADGQAFTGAVVVLVPEPSLRDRDWLYPGTTTDQYGRFTLRGIAPGEYKLFAWEEIERGAYLDPDFLRRCEERGEPIRLREGDTRSVTLKLIPSDPASQ